MTMDDDDDTRSWHPDDERPSKKRKRDISASTKKRSRRLAKPRGHSDMTTDEAKASEHESGDRPRGRERTHKRGKREPSEYSVRTLTPSEAGFECGEVAQHYNVDIQQTRHMQPGPSTSSTRRNTPKRSRKCQRSAPHSEPRDREGVMDLLSMQYVESIEPDLSTVVRAIDRDPSLPSFGSRYLVDEDEPIKRRRASSAPGRRSGSRRHRASPDDTCIVTELLSGPLAELIPPGTHVRRPPEKLVQLVAQVIHESPCKALRVQHVYTALQNRYPYFRFMSKKEVTTWKSSVRHSLYQKWFEKVTFNMETASDNKGRSHAKSNFWRVDYKNRPREWDMPNAPEGEENKDGNISDVLGGLKATYKSPNSDQGTFQEPLASINTPSITTASVSLQQLEVNSDLLSRSCTHPEQEIQECNVLLSPEAEINRLKYETTNKQQHQLHQSQNQKIKLHQQREEQHQPQTCDSIPIPASPWGADLLTPLASGLPSPQAWIDSVDEIAAIIQCEPFGAEALESRPNSRLSPCSLYRSEYSGLSSFMGSPGRLPSHTEQPLEPNGDQFVKMEPLEAPSFPSMYLRTNQEWYPSVDNALSTGANLSKHRNSWSPEALSTGLDSTLWNVHVGAKEDPEGDAHFGTRGPLGPPTPAPHASGGFAFPPAQRAPEHKLPQKAESFRSPEQFKQNLESMMAPPTFTSRASPHQSRECTLTGELPLAAWRALSPQAYTLPQRQNSSGGQDFVLRGRWFLGPLLRPRDGKQDLSTHDQRKLKFAPRYCQPTYCAIRDTAEVIRMKDGTVYILSWPTDVDGHSIVEHARCVLE